MHNSEKEYQRRSRAPIHNDYHEEGEYYDLAQELPPHGFRTSLLIGIGAGLLSWLVPVIITIINSALYRTAAELGENMPYGLASTLFWLGCLYGLFSMVVAFLAGFFTAKRTVLRRFGFYAGILVGAITQIGNVVIRYIPDYPGNITQTSTASSPEVVTAGILTIIGLIVIYALIGGLLGYWGARIATNNHPYHLQKAQEAEVE